MTPGRIKTLSSGAKVMLHTCDVCGSDNAPYGWMLPGQLSQWFCRDHRDQMQTPCIVEMEGVDLET